MYKQHFQYVVYLIVGLTCCCGCSGKQLLQAPTQTKTQMQDSWSTALKAAHEAEAKLFKLLPDGANGSDVQTLADEMQEKERKLIRLELSGKAYEPLFADVGTQLDNKYKCRWDGIDNVLDSYFVYYLSPTKVRHSIVPCQSGQIMTIKMAWKPSQLEQLTFYTGDPGEEMHQNGYRNVLELDYNGTNGQLNYKARDPKLQQALFVILKAKDDRLYRRFIFVIMPKSIADQLWWKEEAD